MSMSASDTPPPPGAEPVKAAAKKSADSAPTDVQVSAMVPAELKQQIELRAADEDRTVGVIVRRALKAYMKDWKPGADD